MRPLPRGRSPPRPIGSRSRRCLLPVATAFAAAAHSRLQRVPETSGWAAVTPASTGLLLGWTALASTVNFVAGAVATGFGKVTPGMVAGSTAGLLAASGAVASAVARSRRGALPLAASSAWGLLTLALARGRPRSVRVAGAAGAATIAVAALKAL